MSASDRYSGCGSSLDEFIAALTDVRDHGAPGHLVVKAFDPDIGSEEAVTGFVISRDDNAIRLYTDDDT